MENAARALLQPVKIRWIDRRAILCSVLAL